MNICTIKNTRQILPRTLILCAMMHFASAQTPVVPDWAQPASATHQQVSPPADFHRPSTNFDTTRPRPYVTCSASRIDPTPGFAAATSAATLPRSGVGG